MAVSIIGGSERVAPSLKLVAEAEFEDFAPANSNCEAGCCINVFVQNRLYMRLYDNHLETNVPFAPQGCCTTSEDCISDRVTVYHYDQQVRVINKTSQRAHTLTHAHTYTKRLNTSTHTLLAKLSLFYFFSQFEWDCAAAAVPRRAAALQLFLRQIQIDAVQKACSGTAKSCTRHPAIAGI